MTGVPPPLPPETSPLSALVLPFADEEDVVMDAALAWIDHCLELERIEVAHTVLNSCNIVLAPRPAPSIDVFNPSEAHFFQHLCGELLAEDTATYWSTNWQR